MTIATIITALGSALVSFLTSLGSSLVSLFTILFYGTSDSTGTITIGSTLGTVGTFALAFVVIGLAFKVMPTVVGWLQLRSKKKARKRR